MSGRNGKIAPSAPGASSLCPASVIPASHADAPQTLAIEGEPHATPPTCSSGAGRSMTRRLLMNSIVALPIAAAVPVASPAMSPPSAPNTDRRALEAYASWLFMERRILCGELWPHMGAEAERYDWFDNAGAGWHFRGDGDWQDLPQPSTRAAAVLDLVGVDWRQPKRDLGLDHEDTGHRPELPTGWPAIHPDERLLELERKIFKHKARFDDLQPETDRLDDIWCKENHRLAAEFEKTQIWPTFDERRAITDGMPEYKEFMRLRGLQEYQREAADRLVKQMWEMEARRRKAGGQKCSCCLGTSWKTMNGAACSTNLSNLSMSPAREIC